MRKLLLAVAVMAAASTVQADFVIDNFTTGNTTQTDAVPPLDPASSGTFNLADNGDATGTRELIVAPFSGGVFVTTTIGGGGIAATSTGAGGNFRIEYDLGAPVDLHSGGNFPGSPLVLDMFDNVLGEWELVVTYSSSTSGETESFDAVTIDSAGKIGFNGADLGRGLLASTVDSIVLDFTATAIDTGTGVAAFDATNASVAAVPEPASIALLGLTGIAGGFVYRRRRKTEQGA